MVGIPGDTYDPCDAYIRLRDAYEKVALGQTVKRVRFHNGEEQRETEFNPGNIEALEKLMNSAKAECLLKNGGRPRRSAIGIGRLGPQVRTIY